MSKEKTPEKQEKKAGARVRYGMVIDLRRCIGCHSCSVACKAELESPLGVYRSWVKIVEKGTYPGRLEELIAAGLLLKKDLFYHPGVPYKYELRDGKYFLKH